MAERLRVVRRRFRYPVGPSVEIVRLAGGVSRVPEGERATLRFREVGPGEDCSDMPAESARVYLERGDIVRVTGEEPIDG